MSRPSFRLCHFSVAAIFFFCGCAKLAHLDQLLTLKHYSDNQQHQAEYIETQDEKFEQLLALARSGNLSGYETQESFLKAFGEPVFSRPADCAEAECELWFYRYAMKMFDSPKVYLYFGTDGLLRNWELVLPEKTADGQQTQDQS